MVSKDMVMLAQLNSKYIKLNPLKALKRVISYALFEGRPMTTRGSWFNHFVFGHFKFQKKFPQLRPVEKPIFIIGIGRSGTTLLGLLMSMHMDVGFLNEPKALWHSILPYEDIIGSYSRGPAKYRLDVKDVNEEIRKSAHRLFGAYLRLVNCKRLVDKYPEAVFRVPFIQSIFPDAKFVFIVRNGWDTCSSIEKWSKSNVVAIKDETHDWWGVNYRKWSLLKSQILKRDEFFSTALEQQCKNPNQRTMALMEWIASMREGLRIFKNNRHCTILIRYEELLNDPEAILKDILCFCDLKNDEKMFEYAKSIVKRQRHGKQFKIPEEIQPIFYKTMNDLGYA